MDPISNNSTPITAVQVTQELLALQSARLEKQGLEKAIDADPLVSLLRDELSLYGDNVAATVDRTDPYYESTEDNDQLFLAAIHRVHDKAGEIPESLDNIVRQLLAAH